VIARLRRFIGGLSALFRKRRVEQELDEELHAFLDTAVEERMQAGMSREHAIRAARIETGSPEAVKDRVRDVGWETMVESFWQDLRYAGRTLRKSPGLAATAILTLALGIGANTAVFTLVDAVLLATLPVEDPKQLVVLDVITARGEKQNLSYPLFQRIRDEVEAFSGVFAAADGVNRMEAVAPETGSRPEEVRVQLVSGEYFPVLGVHALVGRTLNAGDNRSGGEPRVAVLSHGFWSRRFAGDPSAIGTRLVIKGQALTIVGVARPGFFGEAVGRAPDVWVPLAMQPRFDRGMSLLDRANVGWLRVVGRLRAGESESTAGAALALVLTRMQSEVAAAGRSARRTAVRVSDGSRGLPEFRERFSLPLRILAAIVTVVLLIACANVANLLLARASARQSEMGVRLAIGAGRRRLVRQLLTENLLLATAGGLLGLLFAWWGSRLLLVVASGDGIPIPIDVSLGARVLGFTAALSAMTVAIFGLVPALTLSRADVGTALKSASNTRTRPWLAPKLVITQVALSLALLTSAALLVQTLANLRMRDLGFAADELLEVHVELGASGYKREQIPDLSRRLRERLDAAPGVQSASFTHSGFGTGMSTTCCIAVEGYAHEPGEDREIRTLGVVSGYFGTMRLPLVRGRDFAPQEIKADPADMSVVIVNEAFARRYVGDGRAIGTRFGWGNPPEVTYGFEIVGVARDAVYDNLRENIKPLVYFPFSWGDTFVVRAAGPPEAVRATIRQAIVSVDPDLEASIGTVTEALERAVTREKLLSRLSVFFGVLATVLAGTGLYGLMAYTVVRRTPEIGLRMALGAASGSVLRAEMVSALRLVAWGIAAGVPVALAAGRILNSQLFGISSADAVTIAVAAFLLACIAGAAAFLPARRASRVDPLIALRRE